MGIKPSAHLTVEEDTLLNAKTHRAAWSSLMDQVIGSAEPATEDRDDVGYFKHEKNSLMRLLDQIEAVHINDQVEGSTPSQDVWMDAQTHRAAWGSMIDKLIANADPASEDCGDLSYLLHEKTRLMELLDLIETMHLEPEAAAELEDESGPGL